MSDESVSTALRSNAKLVVIEAPAGCGKTFQGAEYARHVTDQLADGRILILTHTHAACDVFAARTRSSAGRVDIRTIDSLICEIASVYHRCLDLPHDAGAWARNQADGFSELACKVARLMRISPMIGQVVAQRYPIIICDEHQDASSDQHAIVLACHAAGASVRVFADPMQRIFGGNAKADAEAHKLRWDSLKKQADLCDQLDTPHRWRNGSEALGQWILRARQALQEGKAIDARPPWPSGVSFIYAENQAQRHGGYSLSKGDRKPIDSYVNSATSMMVLSSHNLTVDSLRAFFNRRLSIWEGHMRESLWALVQATDQHRGDATKIGAAVIEFLNQVGKGFSPSACGDKMLEAIASGCVAKRTKKPATLQALGRLILDEPDHKGIARMLRQLWELKKTDPAFEDIAIDYTREFWDAIRIGDFDDPKAAFADLSQRRTRVRVPVPDKAISTIHKAKGLECTDVLIIPIDAAHFSNSEVSRCRLYVAISRATHSLKFVVSRTKPSPLVSI
jgi:DNA helicase-2/ATP-dependent DNA helicase PcrA